MVPGDDAQPARVDAVLATSRAFGNFRFKDVAQTPGGARVVGTGWDGGIKKHGPSRFHMRHVEKW